MFHVKHPDRPSAVLRAGADCFTWNMKSRIWRQLLLMFHVKRSAGKTLEPEAPLLLKGALLLPEQVLVPDALARMEGTESLDRGERS